MSDSNPLTKDDLGHLEACESCGRMMYSSEAVRKHPGRPLPEGFTSGDRKATVLVHGKVLHVCLTCRYDIYGAY